MAFGTFNYGLNREQLVNYYIDEPSGGAMAERPLVQRLLSHKPYLDIYHGYLEELLEGPFDISKLNLRIDELARLIRPYVKADKTKFFSTEQFEANLSADVTGGWSMGGRPPGLKDFIAARSKSVREQLAGTRESSQGDGSGNGGRFGFGPRFDFPERPRQPPPGAPDNRGNPGR
jgi:spore coat protein H